MAEYELIIERKQPPCGSKPSKLYDFQSVTTDDPEGYVREHEPRAKELQVENRPNGEVEVTLGEGFNEVRYIFSPQKK